MNQKSTPIFNLPPLVIALVSAFCVVHLYRLWFLTDEADVEFLLRFAFVPIRYDESLIVPGALPGGSGADIWTFVTYAFLHADWMHLGVNAAWFLAFGTAMERRLGAVRFLIFFAATAAAGAVAHLMTHAGEIQPMVGASGAISGAMAGSMRFAFQPGGPLQRWSGPDAYRVPAIPLLQALTDTRILVFLVVWFGINLVFGLGSVSIAGAEQPVAWQAHIGGFLAGLLLFGMFDPVSSASDTAGRLEH